MTSRVVLPGEPPEPSLSGLRGIALLMVVEGHLVQRVDRFVPAALEHGGVLALLFGSLMSPAIGVYLFFAISGLLIARSLDGGRLTLGQFYLRRLLRIAPPYAILLVATFLLMMGLGWEPPQTLLYHTRPDSLLASLLASLTFTHGVLYGTYPRLFPPGWTLEIEVQFYLVAPLLQRLLRLLEARIGLAGASALALGAAGAGTVATIRSDVLQLQPTLLVYLPLFLVGMVAHRMWRRGWRPSSCMAPPLGWVALLIFVVTQQPWVGAPGAEIAARTALIGLMFTALAARRGSFRRVCASRPMVAVGTAAYSIYLVNLQVMHVTAAWVVKANLGLPPVALAALIAVLGSLLVTFCATGFYAMIEKPALALSDRVVRRARVPGGAPARLASQPGRPAS